MTPESVNPSRTGVQAEVIRKAGHIGSSGHHRRTEAQPTHLPVPARPNVHTTEQGLTPREVAIVEATALRVVELLEARRDLGSSPRLVDAATLSSMLGVCRSTVYEHADELGAVRLGGGAKPRLRFDPERAKAAVSRSESARSQPVLASADGQTAVGERRGRRRLPNGLPKTGSVLAIRASKKVA